MKTQKGTPIHHLIAGFNNLFLIESQKEWILVDTGRRLIYPKLKRRLEKKLPKKTPLLLFLTHTHYDHCQNAAKLKKDFNAKIMVSQTDLNYIRKGYSPIPNGTFFSTKLVSFLGRKLKPPFIKYQPFEEDIPVDDEFVIPNESVDLKAIKTAGHSAGSMSLIVDHEIALVGDALFGVQKNSVFPPFADDVPEMIRSWKKLLDTGCEWYLPGHGRKVHRSLLKKEYEKHAKSFL